MKNANKIHIIIVAATLILAVVIGTGVIILNKNAQVENLNLQNADLTTTIVERDSLVNEFVNTFEEIEESLTFIHEKRNQLKLAKEENLTSNREGILEDIKLMNTMLEESRKKIEELNNKLNSRGFKINALNARIEQLALETEELNNNVKQLKAALSFRDDKIAKIDEDVVQLKNEIEEKNDTISVKSQSLVKIYAELNKVFFTKGTFNELQQKGILAREGGFLGLGRNIIIQDNFNTEICTELDKREIDSIPLFNKKPEIITVHPKDSYSFDNDGDQITYLKIKDSDEFWKVSNYLIVKTK